MQSTMRGERTNRRNLATLKIEGEGNKKKEKKKKKENSYFIKERLKRRDLKEREREAKVLFDFDVMLSFTTERIERMECHSK